MVTCGLAAIARKVSTAKVPRPAMPSSPGWDKSTDICPAVWSILLLNVAFALLFFKKSPLATATASSAAGSKLTSSGTLVTLEPACAYSATFTVSPTLACEAPCQESVSGAMAGFTPGSNLSDEGTSAGDGTATTGWTLGKAGPAAAGDTAGVCTATDGSAVLTRPTGCRDSGLLRQCRTRIPPHPRWDA